MPQMFPMNWLFMFLTFIIVYLLTTIFINYNYNQTPSMIQAPLPKMSSNWKW
uniref:ATP synthase F0 subunit 8 n=1 Tax=Tropostreptus severus TaxID=2931684 RepID=A0A8T9JAU6_9MYRI|nr:ATP synthase F0 subunit 8 [Tropostreptus severus]UOF70377.1 ATP synthase F0 subunit 8 [Tropostreptus severus]